MGRHKELRNQIDQVDQELVKLFEERMRISTEIAEYKIANDIPVLDSQREQLVIDKNKSYLKDHSLDNYISDFSKYLMELSRRRQKEVLARRQTKTC